MLDQDVLVSKETHAQIGESLVCEITKHCEGLDHGGGRRVGTKDEAYTSSLYY